MNMKKSALMKGPIKGSQETKKDTLNDHRKHKRFLCTGPTHSIVLTSPNMYR